MRRDRTRQTRARKAMRRDKKVFASGAVVFVLYIVDLPCLFRLVLSIFHIARITIQATNVQSYKPTIEATHHKKLKIKTCRVFHNVQSMLPSGMVAVVVSLLLNNNISWLFTTITTQR